MNRVSGSYEGSIVGGEAVQAFVPHSLPVAAPPIRIEATLAQRLNAAEEALRRLDLAAGMVPSVDWFIYGFVRKEAVVSSQIEGTQATLVDLMQFESSDDANLTPDVEEVCNYVDALRYARDQLGSTKGLPLSVRLLNETHKRLMKGVRGAHKSPRQVRRTQNWIGGSRPGNAVFVPPPPQRVGALLAALEKYLHADDSLPPLVRAGLIHVQFETIHPYLDGNGRIGRLLIALLLEHWQLIHQPLLYLSLFFKRHQAEYYRRLGAVRTDGDWEGWLDFFLDGVATIGEEAVTTARELFATVTSDRVHVLEAAASSVASLRLFEALPKHPIVTVASAMKILEASKPTAGRAVDALVGAGVLQEMTGRQRSRSFAYGAYMERLRVGTELDGVRALVPAAKVATRSDGAGRRKTVRKRSKSPP
ncbi:Fic family protein [Povalibacter sp.]|uniref:Fic family protein n=1 Tax=Povalibacter sp. TaxID=1962978 RepID=UPI002F3EE74E